MPCVHMHGSRARKDNPVVPSGASTSLEHDFRSPRCLSLKHEILSAHTARMCPPLHLPCTESEAETSKAALCRCRSAGERAAAWKSYAKVYPEQPKHLEAAPRCLTREAFEPSVGTPFFATRSALRFPGRPDMQAACGPKLPSSLGLFSSP
ncbi:hypothetical protein C2E23DRAFT_220426 [Lenzites betulinus]|nr:hypothetical protein C2E23DRAFT_220426 [Lenzites betulinus]